VETTTSWPQGANPNAQPVTDGHVEREVYSSSEWSCIAPVWAQLSTSTPRGSFFLSDKWVSVWIETFASKLETSILLFKSGDKHVGACLLVNSKPRQAMIRLRRISLNTSGEAAADTTYIEFNNLLCLSGWEEPIAANLVGYLGDQQWDEVALDGFSPGPAYDALKKALAPYDLEETWQPSYYVDLAKLRQEGLSHEMALGKATRKHLRQTSRSYSKIGPLKLQPAHDLAEALGMFDELAELNRRRSLVSGRQSVFSSHSFANFHRRLIRRCWCDNSVHLMRLTAGHHTVGLLYNLVHCGKVYFYQCGFDFGEDKRLRPGVITLALAIQYYANLHLDDWDFLSGEAEYKRVLSTGSRLLVWAVFRRPSWRVQIVQSLRAGKQWQRCLQGRLAVKERVHE